MRKWLNNPWFAGLLAIIALGAVVQSVWPTAGSGLVASSSQPESAPAPSEETAAVALSPSQDALASVALVTAPRELFPLQPLVTTKESPSESNHERTTPFVLSAIWTQGLRSLAVVNDTIMEIGDKLDPFVLLKIDGEGVWLQRGDEITFLALGQVLSVRLSAPTRPSSR